MFIGRNEDGSIYGLWTVRQWEGQEELPDADTDVVGFVGAQAARFTVPQPTIADVIAVLPQASKDALTALKAAK